MTTLLDSVEPVRARPARSRLIKCMGMLWRMTRALVFLVLYWLRWPAVLVASLISGPTLVAFLFALWAFPEHHTMVVALGVTSFAAFALQWLYDGLLLWLSPNETMRLL